MDSVENLLIKVVASLKNIRIPAKTPKSGAVRKNLRGAEIGGAWSIESPLSSKRKP